MAQALSARRRGGGDLVCAAADRAGVGFISAWGPFGLVDSWQVELFGSGNVILLVILFMPLAFAPLIAAHLRRVDASTPLLFGIRQSFDRSWGPRIDRGPMVARTRLRRSVRFAQVMAALGAAVLAFFVWKGARDAAAPHSLLPRLGYARLVDARSSPPYAARVTGAVADRSREWVYRYSVRQDMHIDVYYPLRPSDGPARAPAALIELDQTSPRHDPTPWNSIDPPGPREGLIEPLDDWTAGQLRRAAVTLASRVVVLKRRQLGGRDPRPDPLDDYVFGMFGAVALICGLLFWWSFARAERQFAEPADQQRDRRRGHRRSRGPP